MKIKAKLKNLRISPRKVRVSADMVRGCLLDEAIFRLENVNRRANEPLKKLLQSAKANAENNFDVDVNEVDLKVAEIRVDEGLTLKRWRPRAFGRAAQILKRSSHITVVLETVDKKEESEVKKAVEEKKEKTKEVKNEKKDGKGENDKTTKKVDKNKEEAKKTKKEEDKNSKKK